MDIPEELVTEILVRLPVKSLLKFRKVCKSWDDVIRSPQFADMHLKHPSQKSRTEYMVIPKRGCRTEKTNAVLKFYLRDDEDGGLIPLANPTNFPLPRNTSLRMCGPCNGIICNIVFEPLQGYAFYLCNPATRQLRRIPKSHLALEDPGDDYRAFLAQGFGFDPRINEYKVWFLYIQSLVPFKMITI